jgi:ligand-binding sensor domain-containing protein
MAVDEDGEVWFGWQGALFRPTGETWARVYPSGEPFSAKAEVHTLGFDPDGRLWVGTTAGRVLRMDKGGSLDDVQMPAGAGAPLAFEFAEDRT